jgi:hypothetical protein
MRNDYEYIDPDYAYTDPQTGVLRNLAGISDNLDVYERYMSGTIDGDVGRLATMILELLKS